MDLERLGQWPGNAAETEAVISADTANLMQATLNRKPTFKTGDVLPPAWHWLYFHEPVPAGNLGNDGHAQLGGFMPPVDFGTEEPPRRMWAGGKMAFDQPILLGDRVIKRSRVESITPKEGRSGRLVFVVVEHELSLKGERCLSEAQTIVYREPVKAGGNAVAATPAPLDGEFSAAYRPDAVMLFRYSALTFNSHRIHYDVDYCREHEGYPDLVVHGPLTATLLLDLFYRRCGDRQIAGFTYRGVSPLFISHPFTVHGKSDGQAWASNATGGLAMSARVSFA